MDRISFQVAEFDAPLDLILHLISKHKLDIIEIDISSLLDQYLKTIQTWQTMDLDVASEFLQMASRLVYMKTVSLLPRHQEESKRLRADLSGELMEYRICKLAAELLEKENQYEDTFIRDPLDFDFDYTYTHTHSAQMLYAAFVDAVGRGERRKPPPKESFEPLVNRPIISVSSKIYTVLRTLRMQKQITLEELFNPETGRSGLVATFLAVLELMKSGSVYLKENTLHLRDRKSNPS